MKHLYRSAILISLAILSSGCGTNVKQNNPNSRVSEKQELPVYLLKMPDAEKVSFSGYVNFDEYDNPAGGQGVMYSGYSGASFLASVLAHAIISQSVDEAKMNKFIAQSDAVLEPYRSAIDTFEIADLQHAFLEKYSAADTALPLVASVPEDSVALGELRVAPEFVISKNGLTLLIENQFDVTERLDSAPKRSRRSRSSKPQPKGFGSKVIVVGDVIEQNPEMYWNGENGLQLKRHSAELFRESVELFANHLKDQNKQSTAKQETIKYAIGDVLKIERGTVLERSCTRVVFKSLRGWIKSAPIHPDYRKDTPECTTVSAKT